MPENDFSGVAMKVTRVGGSKTTNEIMIKIKKSHDTEHSFATPLLTGQTYNIDFKDGIDFDHIGVMASTQF